jgi:hypothetical protein
VTRPLAAIATGIGIFIAGASYDAHATPASTKSTEAFAGDDRCESTLHLDVVFDEKAMSAATLSTAEDDVSAMFKMSGFSTVWRHWSTGATPSLGNGFHVTIHLLSALTQFPGFAIDTMGIAIIEPAPDGAHHVFVLPRAIEQTALHYGSISSRLLGSVIAHEVGHHVLPAPGHAQSGVMQPRLDPRDQLLRAFAPEQSRLMHERVRAECARYRLASSRESSQQIVTGDERLGDPLGPE